MRMSIVVVGALAVVACGAATPKPGVPAPNATSRCRKAADQVVIAITKNIDADTKSKVGMVDSETADKIRHVMVERCETDKWATEVQQCFVAAATIKDADKCGHLLTDTQRDAIDHQMAAALGSQTGAPSVQPESAKHSADPCDGGE